MFSVHQLRSSEILMIVNSSCLLAYMELLLRMPYRFRIAGPFCPIGQSDVDSSFVITIRRLVPNENQCD